MSLVREIWRLYEMSDEMKGWEPLKIDGVLVLEDRRTLQFKNLDVWVIR